MTFSFYAAQRLALIFLCAILIGCTATKPPDYRAMAHRESIVPGEEITVQRTENLYAFAKRNKVRMSELIALNNLKPPFVVRPGQRLVLPSSESLSPLGEDGAPVPRSAPLQEIKKVPLTPSGGITAVPLDPPVIKATPAAPTTAPSAKIPFGAPSQPIENHDEAPAPLTDSSAPDINAPVPPASKTLTPAPTTVSAQTVPPRESAPAKQEWKNTPPSTLEQASTEAASPSGDAPTFIWPIQGPILSGFGAKGQGTNNDGINIAAPKGAPVVAAAGGMVAYAGNDMKGFGNLILIRHAGGWVTAYAHLDRMIVAKDSAVAAGDMIATVGTTGGIAAPQLHFETRQNGKAVDPQRVIKK